jgi:predicted ATPase/class 3 adenylate cyclase
VADPASGEPAVGSVVGGFEIQAELGRGAMGVVYLARDLALGRNVALKLVVPHLVADEAFRRRFVDESRLAAAIDHSHIIPVYDAGEDAGRLFIAMRYVSGTDLAELLRADGKLAAQRAVDVVAQVGEALDAAHAAGLIHRDVKPSNVLVTRESRREHCYLSDFGLSRASDVPAALPGDGRMLSGTPAYAAPELIAGEPAGGAADRYALACVLYECLTGSLPFPGDGLLEMLWAHLMQAPTPVHAHVSSLSGRVDEVFARALAVEPAERFPSCHDFVEAARTALGPLPASREAPSLPRGTVTLLFTDVEGSTLLLRELGAVRYRDALDEHRRSLRAAVERHGGVEVDTQGDAFFVAFADPSAAVAAAAAAQAALTAGPVSVRMGLHTGTPLVSDEGYIGMDVHKAARICAAGHGGQVLLSESTAVLVSNDALRPLGVHRLKDLSEAETLYQLGGGDFPPLRSLGQTNLPSQATPFLGRERELGEILSLIASAGTRLLTLTGPGGTGKTRLAVQAAAQVVDSEPHGVWWVDLQGIGDSDLVLPTIGTTLAAGGELVEHIADRQMLLVLDNFEQLLEAATEIGRLLDECPNLRLLVTSREPLHLRSEREYRVSPLVPEEAIGFFLSRGREVRPDLEPGAAVAEICRRLDHLPLALELAAARLRGLSADQLLARLDERLPLLTAGPRDAPERQRTLEATIGWSHALLARTEQQVFARLAVFAGGFTLAAAEAVASAGLDDVQSLVEKSLVRFDGTRYSMLQTIREYAAGRLADEPEGDTVRRRHAECLLELAREAGLESDSDNPERPELVIPEIDNVRAALEWAAVDDPRVGLELVLSLEHFWVAGRPFEGTRWLDLLLERVEDVGGRLRARVLRTRGGLIFIVGRFDEGTALFEESLDEYRRLADDRGIGMVVHRLANSALAAGDLSRARVLAEEAARILGREEWKKGESFALATLGEVACAEGDYEAGLADLERAARLAHEAGNTWWESGILLGLADHYRTLGRQDEAERWARAALQRAHGIGERQHAVYALALLAGGTAGRGDQETAGRFWGALEREEQQGPLGQWEDERAVYAARVFAVAGDRFERALQDGRRLTLAAAVQLALRDAAAEGST